MQFPQLQIRIPAIIILGMLNLHVDKGVIDITKDMILPFLYKIVTATKECSSTIKLDYISVSLLELLRAVNGLALNEKVVEVFLENNILLSLLKLLKESDNDDDKLEVIDVLWTLATHSIAKELLCTNSEVVEKLKSLSDFIPAAKCVLQKVEGWNHIEGKQTTYIVECRLSEQLTKYHAGH